MDDIKSKARERGQKLKLPYAGALLPAEAHALMQKGAKLVDVRTDAELHYVGSIPGSETIEWMEGRADPPSVILHITQSLSWIEKSRRSAGQSNSALPPARITFYADALNTLSLLDASILSGSRSASYETRQALDPIPGLPDAPEFGSKLTITVTLLRLP